jgi:Tol biopolymer transport system component
LTSERHSILPVWNSVGDRVTFATGGGIAWQPADGSGKETMLVAAQPDRYPTSWSPDGRHLLFTEDNPTTGMDLWVHERDRSGSPRPLLVRPFNDAWARFSADGQWVAYTSDESGTPEVYVAHYPDMERKVIASTNGGNWPVWSHDGHELFYRQGSAVMAVPVETKPALHIGTSRRLFDGPYAGADGDRKFDVTPDGRRFLMIERVDPTNGHQLVVVLNWTEELKQRVPTK